MGKRLRRRRLLYAVIALAVVLTLGYAYATRPSALRARLAALFEKLDLDVWRIGDISFSPWSGLHVSDVEIGTLQRSPPLETGIPTRPPLLRVPQARVVFDAWSLLLGELKPRRVELDHPTIAILWPGPGRVTQVPRWNTESWVLPRELPPDLPRLTIKAATLEVFAAQAKSLHLQRRWVVDGSGAIVGNGATQPQAYVLRFDQVAGPASTKQRSATLLAELRWQGEELVATTGWTSLELLESLFPAEWTDFRREWNLCGQVGVERLVLEGGKIASANVRFSDLGFAVPIESGVDLTPAERFAHVSELAGSLRWTASQTEGNAAWTRGNVVLEAAGRLNDATAEFSLRLPDASIDTASGGKDRLADDALGFDDLRVGKYETLLRIGGLTLPTMADNPQFVHSPRLPGAVRSAFRKYDTRGPVNFELELWGQRSTAGQAEAAVHYRGELEALGNSCCYIGFPYRVEDARGFLRFSDADGIQLDGLEARHGVTRIRADGRLADSTSHTGFELTFRAQNVATDRELYAALPPKYQRLWRNATPIGLCDATTTLRREHGSEESGPLDTKVVVEARLLSGSLGLLDGTRLRNAEGLIRVAGGVVELEGLQGYADGGLVRVDGTLTLGSENERPQYDMHVEAAGVRLNRTSLVCDSQGQAIGEIRFEGTGDVWAQLNSTAPPGSHYVIRVRDGTLAGFGGGATWQRAKGWISVCDQQQQIRALSALREGGRLEVSGTLPANLGLDRPILLNLEAEDADLQRLLRQLVPGRWANIREALGLAGPGKLAARFHPITSPKAGQQQAADIYVEAARMQPTPVPLELSEIAADLTLQAEGFELHNATARYGEKGRLAVSGTGGWTQAGLWSDIAVEGHQLELTTELTRSMPQPLASLLERLTPTGRLDLVLDRLRLTGTQQQQVWNVAGRLRLEGEQINLGIPLTDFEGELQGTCEIRENNATSLDAGFSIDHGLLANRRIEHWEGRLLCEPGDQRIHLKQVRGELCGGQVAGFGVIDPASSSYELSFTVNDVSLERFLQRESGGSDSTRPGRLDGHIFVRGSMQDPTQRTGGGNLCIREASMLSSAVTASVAEAGKRHQKPMRNEVQRAEIRFVWEGQELKFNRIDIHARDLRLIGMGRWNMRSNAVSMTLLGATPENAPRLFLLTDLLESAAQELVQYRVEGTASQPRVSVEPLHNLTQPLRKLLRENQDDQKP